MFHCDKCGLCCKTVSMSEVYKDLDRGDGTCRFYNDETRLCNIYVERPLRCRIEECYPVFFADMMTKEEYYEMNYAACNILKANFYRNKIYPKS